MALKFTVNPRRQEYRLAVVVSKKVNKSAVVRNRIRRRLYEIVRLQEIQQPYDMVLTVFDEQVASLLAGELEQILLAQLHQASIIGKNKSQ